MHTRRRHRVFSRASSSSSYRIAAGAALLAHEERSFHATAHRMQDLSSFNRLGGIERLAAGDYPSLLSLYGSYLSESRCLH